MKLIKKTRYQNKSARSFNSGDVYRLYCVFWDWHSDSRDATGPQKTNQDSTKIISTDSYHVIAQKIDDKEGEN